jgi:hypothetical protein
VFEAFKYACCDHAVPVRLKTYAAPDPLAESLFVLPFTPVTALSSSLAPPTTVSPEIATEWPK